METNPPKSRDNVGEIGDRLDGGGLTMEYADHDLYSERDYFMISTTKEGKSSSFVSEELLMGITAREKARTTEEVRLSGTFIDRLTMFTGIPLPLEWKKYGLLVYYGDMAKFIVANVLVGD
jgi:hypothetical protein